MGDRPWDDTVSNELELSTDVSQHGAIISPTPLLIQHGRLDTDVPAASVEALFHTLTPHYISCPELLQLRVYPALAHTISRPETSIIDLEQQQLRTELNDWFARFL